MPGKKKKNLTEPMYSKEQIAEIVGLPYEGRSLDTVLFNYRKEMKKDEHYQILNARRIAYTRKGLTLIRRLYAKSEANRNTYAPKNPHRGKRSAK